MQTIDQRSVRRMNVDPSIERRSKSRLLSRALSSGKLIIVVTLQTFPHVLDALKNDPKMRARSSPSLLMRPTPLCPVAPPRS